jgi:inosine/xanthosine triphosphate pyrophosphatase family protein
MLLIDALTLSWEVLSLKWMWDNKTCRNKFNILLQNMKNKQIRTAQFCTKPCRMQKDKPENTYIGQSSLEST